MYKYATDAYTGNIIQLCTKDFGSACGVYVSYTQLLYITDVPRRFTLCLSTTQTLLYPPVFDSNKSGARAARPLDRRGPSYILAALSYILFINNALNVLFHLVIIIIFVSVLHLINYVTHIFTFKTKINNILLYAHIYPICMTCVYIIIINIVK